MLQLLTMKQLLEERRLCCSLYHCIPHSDYPDLDSLLAVLLIIVSCHHRSPMLLLSVGECCRQAVEVAAQQAGGDDVVLLEFSQVLETECSRVESVFTDWSY